ncbi:MAG: hypothetical protein BDTLLHRC_000230 [Candidatus Fervidibacter sp.]
MASWSHYALLSIRPLLFATRYSLLAAVFASLWLLDRAFAAQLDPYAFYLLRLIGINLILAVSLNLIMGFTGQFSLGHAGFMAVGAYAAAATSKWLVAHSPALAHSPVWQSLVFLGVTVLGGLAAALAGLIVGLPTLRLRGDYLAIATLGFGEIIRVTFVNLEVVGGARGLTDIPPLGVTPLTSHFLWIALWAAVTLWVIYRIVRCTRGIAFQAIREDELAAGCVGINTTYYKVLAFVLGAFFAGVAGALFAHDPDQRYINPDTFKFMKSIEAVVMVIVGGMGSLTGSVMAASVLTVLPETLRSIGEYRMVLYALLLIALMLTRPQGLLGGWELSWRRREEISPDDLEQPLQPYRPTGEPLLRLRDCTMQFGGLVAVRDFRLALRDGELVGLIGPNGAGKTTVFNLVTGIYTPTAGEILLDSRRLDGQPPHLIARWGVARTFQNIRLFKELSVLDNVRAAFVHQAGYSFWAAVLALPHHQKREREIERKCLALLKLFGLHERRHEKAKNLPYGDQRRLEIVRALALAPKVLLLDEPTAGMNPAETQAIMHLIKRLNDEWGLTILLIEHDMRVVMGICQRVIVMDFGEIIAEGSPEQIRTDPKVIAAYLGEPMEVETPADE